MRFSNYDENDTCPQCGEEYDRGARDARCICRDPFYICIPPGKHIHRYCPVHGDVKVYGPKMHWLDYPNNPGTRYLYQKNFGDSPKVGYMTNSMGPG